MLYIILNEYVNRYVKKLPQMGLFDQDDSKKTLSEFKFST